MESVVVVVERAARLSAGPVSSSVQAQREDDPLLREDRFAAGSACDQLLALTDEKIRGIDRQIQSIAPFREELVALRREARQARDAEA